MKISEFTRKWPAVLAILAILASPAAGIILNTSSLHAASEGDPSDEIVYIDVNGFIRVLDPQGSPSVDWFSPTGGWENADLGDVNDDGDMEIVAIGTDANNNVKIAVFDPVMAPNETGSSTLYETTVAGDAELVLSDDFDSGIKGDELLYAYRDVNQVSQVVVMNAANLVGGRPTGRDWKIHEQYTDPFVGRTWRFGASGYINTNADGSPKGSAEAVLVDSKRTTSNDLTLFDIFEVDGGFVRIDGKNSGGDTIRKVAVGQIIAGGGEEVAEIRTTKPTGESLRVYKWDPVGSELDKDETWAFAGPEYVFLADLSGNGDKEVLFLRKHTRDDGERLIMVDKWGDDQNSHPDIQESLSDITGGSNNEFKLGVGGDVDGDGRDEIIISSRSRIVVFRDPHISVAANTRTEYVLPHGSSNDTLLVGDLDDRDIKGPIFSVDTDHIIASIPTGTSKGGYTVELKNVGEGGDINYSVIGPIPDWVKVNPMSGNTPATLELTFDATNIPVGVKKYTMELTSSANVINKPLPIKLEMKIEPAELSVEPYAANTVYFPCSPPITTTMNTVINVVGTAGLNYEAVILGIPEISAAGVGPLPGMITGGEVNENGVVILYDDTGRKTSYPSIARQPEISASSTITIVNNNVEWITEATAITNTVPSTISLSVNPSSLGNAFTTEHAIMVIVADTRAGSPPENIDIVPITMMCAQDRVLAPTVRR